MAHRELVGWMGALMVCTGIVATVNTGAAADEFILKNGGKIRGELVSRIGDKSTPAGYLIATEYGGRMVLKATQVAKVDRHSKVERRYHEKAHTVADNVEAQWRLAEWCRKNHLSQLRRFHLLRIVELDPEHAPARRGLRHVYVGGKWHTPKHWQERLGIVKYRGRWRAPQEVQALQKKRDQKVAQKQWAAKIRRLRSRLQSEKGEQAYAELAAIRDPLAVMGLAEQLQADRWRVAKLLYVQVLSKIATDLADSAASDQAIAALVHTSLNGQDEEVIHACIDELAAMNHPGVDRAFIGMLKSKQNVHVNRAAYALKRLDNPAAMGPLIAALITTHVTIIPPRRNAGGLDMVDTSMSRDSAGGSGFTLKFQDQATAIRKTMRNSQVLRALVHLSGGQNFGYDQKAWENWHAAQLAGKEQVEGRRDAN